MNLKMTQVFIIVAFSLGALEAAEKGEEKSPINSSHPDNTSPKSSSDRASSLSDEYELHFDDSMDFEGSNLRYNGDFGNMGKQSESFSVVLDPLYRTSLSAEVVSPVEKIYKRMGDSFEPGELLIQLNPVVFKAVYEKARLAVIRARSDLESTQRLFDQNIASLFELKRAQADLAAAESDLATATRSLDASAIRAPYGGKVVEVFLEENELPEQGKQIISLVDDRVLLAKLLVPSALLSQISLGSPIEIHVRETGDVIDAYVSRIGSVIDPSSSTIKIEAEIDNQERRLKPGMTGTATFKRKKEESTDQQPEDKQELQQDHSPIPQKEQEKHQVSLNEGEEVIKGENLDKEEEKKDQNTSEQKDEDDDMDEEESDDEDVKHQEGHKDNDDQSKKQSSYENEISSDENEEYDTISLGDDDPIKADPIPGIDSFEDIEGDDRANEISPGEEEEMQREREQYEEERVNQDAKKESSSLEQNEPHFFDEFDSDENSSLFQTFENSKQSSSYEDLDWDIEFNEETESSIGPL